jgi:hypothetical protein
MALVARSSSFSAVLDRVVSDKSFGAIADSFRPARRPAMISRCQFITFIASEASSAVGDCPLAAGDAAGADILGSLLAIGSRADGSSGGSRSGLARRDREAVLPDNHALSSMICSRCSSTNWRSSLTSRSRRIVRSIVSACATAIPIMLIARIWVISSRAPILDARLAFRRHHEHNLVGRA